MLYSSTTLVQLAAFCTHKPSTILILALLLTQCPSFLQTPNVLITTVKCIFRYVAGTLDLVLCYDGNCSTIVDADYGGDITDRKSLTGTLIMLNHAPVAWYSCKQNCVATSTTESEYIVASSTTKDVI